MNPPSEAMRDAEQLIREGLVDAPDPGRAAALADLRGLLRAVHKLDPSREGGPGTEFYPQRNVFVLQAVALALVCDMPAGIVPDWESDAWVIAYIELPTGQVSWHLPAYEGTYDGHTTVEKYQRVTSFASTAGSGS